MSDDEFLGLDDNIDEDLIYIESSDMTIISINKKYLKQVDLLINILNSDINAGNSEKNTILLPRLTGDVLLMLKKYLEYHKEEDYIVEITERPYEDKVLEWDRLFIDELIEKKLFDKFLECTNYFLIQTLSSKLCCYLAQCEKDKDYKELFRLLYYEKNKSK